MVPQVSVVIAASPESTTLAAILERLDPDDNGALEVIVVGAGPLGAELRPGVRALPGPAGRLVPELWRDGLLAARAPQVALLSDACIPAADWLQTIRNLPWAGVAGYGGAIVDHPDQSSTGRAITMLRYASYGPERPAGPADDIAADNAAYDRAQILLEQDLLARGFFEPNFHRRFAARGLALRFEPAMRVEHLSRESRSAFCRARFRHGAEFGRSRAINAPPFRRLILALAAPALPFVLFAKVVRRVRRRRDLAPYLIEALPSLALFILAWGLGEGTGTWRGLLARPGGS